MVQPNGSWERSLESSGSKTEVPVVRSLRGPSKEVRRCHSLGVLSLKLSYFCFAIKQNVLVEQEF